MKVGIILTALAVALGNAYGDVKDNNVAVVTEEETGKSYEDAAVAKLDEALRDTKSSAEVIEQKLLAADNLFKTAASFYGKENNTTAHSVMMLNSADAHNCKELLKAPCFTTKEETPIAHEKNAEVFNKVAVTMTGTTLAKKLFQEAANYFQKAANLYLRAADEKKENKDLFITKAAECFKNSLGLFEKIGDTENAKVSEKELGKLSPMINDIITRKTEEHLATFVTPAAGGKLQQTK